MVWWPFATKPERADTLEVIDLHSGAPLLYSTVRSYFFDSATYGRGAGKFVQAEKAVKDSSTEKFVGVFLTD